MPKNLFVFSFSIIIKKFKSNIKILGLFSFAIENKIKEGGILSSFLLAYILNNQLFISFFNIGFRLGARRFSIIVYAGGIYCYFISICYRSPVFIKFWAIYISSLKLQLNSDKTFCIRFRNLSDTNSNLSLIYLGNFMYFKISLLMLRILDLLLKNFMYKLK